MNRSGYLATTDLAPEGRGSHFYLYHAMLCIRGTSSVPVCVCVCLSVTSRGSRNSTDLAPDGRGSYFPKWRPGYCQWLEFDPRKALIKLLKVKCMVYFKYSKYTNSGVTIIFAPRQHSLITVLI